MLVPIQTTLGDAVDRLSILQIKHDKRMPINTAIYMDLLRFQDTDGYLDLLRINSVLWDVEDSIRRAHATADAHEITRLSRIVTSLNRERSQVKARIDVESGATPEPKAYFGENDDSIS